MSILDFPSVTRKERKLLLAKARRATGILKSLSHEGRLLILCMLSGGEKSVSEIEELMDMPQAAVSQQLARLRLDGLVTARREGRSIFYSIASKDASRLISTLHDMLKGEAHPMPRRRP
ncbi:MAG: helix-turn-helix transcriptional regulator [Aestuariivirga sp.]|uniref:ArsR/SmtB family transcription factor n=1 Tax=Aestuariivirga sp. TaxID=2650926 RepID=UPI0025BA8E22|nr:metalloregulator ArsR/SmtB family transcription factor [Aestuariivirga sp.]MCA3559835.1 helix-turn-helix transcriptional regulator [Aestuariivirga sp.]